MVYAYSFNHETKKPPGCNMNITETEQLLRTRRNLTGTTYDNDTVDAWQMALAHHDYFTCHRAMVNAARTNHRVNLVHIFDQLPTEPTVDEPPNECELCGGDGWRNVEWPRRHYPRNGCEATTEEDCYCHAVEPCVCTAGRANVDVHRRMVEHNKRTTGR